MTLKLFVADDSPTLQKMVGLAFSGEDVEIESTSTGESLLDLVRDFKPDVILMDAFLPEHSGFEVCARIKEDAELKHIPVVLLGGALEPFDEAEALKAQCDAHLTKPFDTSELIRLVESLAGGEMIARKNAAAAEGDARTSRKKFTSPLFTTKSDSGEARGTLNPRVQESFLGPDRILDLFDRETLASANTHLPSHALSETGGDKTTLSAAEQPRVGLEGQLSDEVLDTIVDRVIRHLSEDVIREVAWEVVPDLSEIIIRRVLEEQKKT
jgi:CheY-like chemotaxis protein